MSDTHPLIQNVATPSPRFCVSLKLIYHLYDHDEFGSEMLVDWEDVEKPYVEGHQGQGVDNASGIEHAGVVSEHGPGSEHDHAHSIY